MKTIFPQELLQDFYSNFKSSNVPNFSSKRTIIEDWVNELKSGKLNSLKEEEVKSRFINNLFGDVLDFNYGNSNYWSLREEAKTKSDGTKPDAALGYFTHDKTKDDVRVIIEIKDANTNLDAKQKREGNKSPIDQAFEYAPKMGGHCGWVIISNFKEIRFYSSIDRNKCQTFLLEKLTENETLKEFLFLFHKDKFISKEKKSDTDKLYEVSKKVLIRKSTSKHILEDIYNCLYRFDGLGFVDPNYICSLYPFNILQEHVWHYDEGTLFTINSHIYNFLLETEIAGDKIVMTEKLEKELIKLKIDNYLEKFDWIITFLNNSHIYNITAIKDYKEIARKQKNVIGFTYLHPFHYGDDEGITKHIHAKNDVRCECLSCNFRTLDFKSMLKNLKTRNGDFDYYNPEFAYGNYLVSTNDFKSSYKIYKYLEKDKYKENKGIPYFLSKLNSKYLFTLIRGYYDGEDKDEILQEIKAIDLDNVIHNELDFEIDYEVKRYLIQIKEEKLFNKVREEVKQINIKIDKLKKVYDDDNYQTGGGDLPAMLSEQYNLLYLHSNRNYIIQDTFSDYKNVFKDIFSGLVRSYLTLKAGINEFNEFYIAETVIHVNPDDLQNILKDVETLKINDDCLNQILKRFNNYFSSFFNDPFFNFDPLPNEIMVEYLLNQNFKNRLSTIFDNIFIVLSKAEVSQTQFKAIEKSVISFLNIETLLYWKDLDYFCHFLIARGNLFESDSLVRIFEIATNREKSGNNKYQRLVRDSCIAINKFYPEKTITNQNLVRKAIANCYSTTSDRTDFRNYMYLSKIADDKCRALIFNAIDESLENEFNEDLYTHLLWSDIYDYKYKDYFERYMLQINNARGPGIFFKGNKMDHYKCNLTFFNFALLVQTKNIQISKEQLNEFNHVSDFEKWILNPDDFNYDLFQSFWLKTISHRPILLGKLSSIVDIREKLKESLHSEFDQELSNIYVKYFLS